MSRNTENSKSYEDIVRQTVMDPDSSQRPTRAQERAAREGFRAMDADETQLHQRVAQAVAGVPGMAGVSVEVTRELVTLRGSVAAADGLRTLEDIVASVPGVDTVHNQVVVA
jgi:HSP20 family molecular chaperone IbpA